MKRHFFSIKSIFALLISVAATSTALAQDEAAPKREKFVVDEVIAVVGSSSIMLSDLVTIEQYLQYQQMQQGYSSDNVRGEAFEYLLKQKLLATQAAIDSLPLNDASIDAETESKLSQLVESRGSTEMLEKFYNKPIFAIKDVVREKMRETEMATTMEQSVQSDVQVTPSDVMKFYKKANKDSLPIIPQQYKLAKISKLPSKSDDRKLDVKEELIKIKDRITNGASFGALARMYSDDVASAARGGEMDPAPSSTYVQEFKDAVETTPIGQISEVIETEYGFHILEVLESKNGLYKVRHILMKIKFDPEDKQKAITTLDSVAVELKADNLKFEDAVKEFSEDDDSRTNDGVMVNSSFEHYGVKYKSQFFSKEELGRMFEKVDGLKPGETTDAFEYFNDMTQEEEVLIVKLLDIKPSHTANIDDDYTIIEEMALNAKRKEVFDNWLNKKIDEMYVYIEKPYRDIKLGNSRWIK